MNGWDLFYTILYYINYGAICLCTVGFVFQFVYVLFCWLPIKHFKKSETLHKIAIIIPARNEEAVIGSTVQDLLKNQTYPKAYFDIFVCADNCTDDTAKKAEEAGAQVFIHDDPNPKHHVAAYPVKFMTDKIMKEHPGYDFFVRFDADNHANPEFLEKMNDAYSSGVSIARAFESSVNGTENVWSKVSACYYIRDSRLPSNYREKTHQDCMLSGAGMMMAVSVLQECGGWDAMSAIEDSEFTLNRLVKNKRIHQVADAIVYEEQPSNAKDTFNRVSRMGHGLNEVFWKKGWKLFGHTFISGKISNLDLFMQIFFVPIGVIASTWFPLYYITYGVLMLCQMNGVPIFSEAFLEAQRIHGISFTTIGQSIDFITDSFHLYQAGNYASYVQTLFVGLLVMGATTILALVLVYIFQTWIALLLSKKHLGLKNLKGYWAGILLSPLFMLFYAVAIDYGVFTNPTWKKVSRQSEHHFEK
jgi:cellulose synthase/poly-beta-1,6-N-acetylglucosamine synthase-like glycosyltransferase